MCVWMQHGVHLATAAATNDQKLHCHFYAQFVLRKYCESFWGEPAAERQSDSCTDGRTDRSAGTGCHVGDIWPNCALMCVCARVCVRHVCARVCVLEQIANGKWPQMFYIFLFAACALISDCYITFHLMLSCSKDIKKSLSVCQLYLSFQLFASLFP